MMSLFHDKLIFGLRLELSGFIAKRLPYVKYWLSVPGIFFNEFVTDIYRVTNKF